jgi:hypothetical protein
MNYPTSYNNYGASPAGYTNIQMMSIACPNPSVPNADCPKQVLNFLPTLSAAGQSIPFSQFGYNSLLAAYGPSLNSSYYTKFAYQPPRQ